MWIANKVAYRGAENFTRAYQGDTLIWDKSAPIEADYILYTSTTGEVVEPYLLDTSAKEQFGANIISNTYSNGQGRITFDGPVVRIGADGGIGVQYGVFWHRDALESVIIPDNVKSIGAFAFNAASNLKTVVLPESIERIYRAAFASCYRMNQINLPKSITALEQSAFSNCNALTSVELPPITTISKFLYLECSGLHSVTLPETTRYILQGAFENCINLDKIEIKTKTPPTIGYKVFYGSNCPIYVPSSAVEDYKAAWTDYASRIEASLDLDEGDFEW